ncbi:Integrase core domain protein [compost metagenome]
MKPRMCSDLAIDAMLMAVWRRKPQQQVMIHSDQGSQFSSSDWQSFLKANNVISSMSRRGNCHDNAVAESFFQLLKRERIRRKIYTTREEARSDIFDYIEMFYNPKRRHSSAMQLSPVEYEKRYFLWTALRRSPRDFRVSLVTSEIDICYAIFAHSRAASRFSRKYSITSPSARPERAISVERSTCFISASRELSYTQAAAS